MLLREKAVRPTLAAKVRPTDVPMLGQCSPDIVILSGKVRMLFNCEEDGMKTILKNPHKTSDVQVIILYYECREMCWVAGLVFFCFITSFSEEFMHVGPRNAVTSVTDFYPFLLLMS